jgi:membrane protease subunit (stomatin/prohibitin family)
MGLFDFVKKQFIDVIEWTEPENGILSFRFPMYEHQIQNGAKLTVRDSQVALFVNEGTLADLFKPGLHTLTTHNLPILTNLNNWDKAFQSPFKSDVYFFSTRDQLDQKWGTPQPITVRDKEFGPLRMRANGNFSYRIEDAKLFYQKISGSREVYRAQELEGQLFTLVTSQLAEFLGKAAIPFVDMAANQMKFSQTLQDALAKPFTEYGLKLQSFLVQSLSLPEELQAHLDKSSSQRIVGDLSKYTQFQAADSIQAAAANPGGIAGAGVGVGAGAAMGQAMMAAMSQGSSGGAGSQEAMASLEKLHDLVAKGVITQADFEAKKAELLKKI